MKKKAFPVTLLSRTLLPQETLTRQTQATPPLQNRETLHLQTRRLRQIRPILQIRLIPTASLTAQESSAEATAAAESAELAAPMKCAT